MVIENCYKFCIHSFREKLIVFKLRSYGFDVKIINIVHKYYAVRVTH